MAVAATEPRCFTLCVFLDATWAARGLEALRREGFDSDRVSVLARQSPEVDTLFAETFGTEPRALEVKGLGTLAVCGPLVEALDRNDQGLQRTGLAATVRRVGFQAHDGFIFQTLTERGGVLVGVESESRAADALAVFHSYGGGNAAIGAWAGRV